MRRFSSRAKRCLSMVLALVLVLSSVPGLGLQAFAAEPTITDGAIVAGNYNLTEAEKALLSSGYLAGGTLEYVAPTGDDGLVVIDTENNKITAASKDGWTPTAAVITYGSNNLDVVLTNGEATYDPDVVGNAFSVKVTYTLTKEVAAETQTTLLSTAGWLNQGVANTDAVSAQAGNLYILEQAMPELKKIAENGIETGTLLGTVNLSDAGKAAVKALNGQMDNNAGKRLDLSIMIDGYDKAESKVQYLLTNGTTMKAKVNETAGYLVSVSDALQTIVEFLDNLLEMELIDETTATQLNTVSNAVNNLKTELDKINAADWTAAEKGTALVKTGITDTEYATLDTLVAALGAIAALPEIKNPLTAATAEVQANAAMYNVTVKVVLNTVQNNAVAQYGEKTVILTLAEGTEAGAIIEAITASGIEADAKAAWGDAYVADKYDRTATELPETLNADIDDYVITYSPKMYTITIADVDAEYPYGYELTLPVHTDPTQSYDYRANGVYYAQGSVVTVEDTMTFTREEGKAYTTGNLLAIIAENYGSDKADTILNSGALNVDETISYREPTKAELEELVKLEGNTLTVQSYASSYEDLFWTPYSYFVDGSENLFNGANQVTISGDFEKVEVYYRLTLTNHTEEDVKEILDLVATLVDEAEGQKSVMDKLAGYEGQMGQLTKNMLNGLNGVIGGYAGGTELNDDPTTNDELVAYFQETIGKIVSECVASNGNLKLYNIILAYNDENNGGLAYYYQNDATVRNEIAVLSSYLNDMLDGGDRQVALEKLMTGNGYSDKVDVLETLSTKLAEINDELKAVNSAIDTSDLAELRALAKALTAEGSVAYTECGSPYIEMGPVTRTAEKFVTVEVKAVIGNKNHTASVTIEKDTALTQLQVDELKSAINTFVSETIETAYYNNDYNNGAELDDLVGFALTESDAYTYTWTAKSYTVKIAGEADQTISIDNLTVTLPVHPQAVSGMKYEYTVPTGTANAGIYTFTKEHLTTLFTDGTYTITRVEKNEAVEKLVDMVNDINADMGFKALALVEENGVYTGVTANISATDMMNLMMGLVLKSGYGYIGLNGEGFIYSNDNAELELSMQTLINAVLADEDFNNDTVIALGENGKGKVMTASMQLGNSAEELDYNDLTFTLNLNSVPSQLTGKVELLKTVSNYVYFQSNNGVLDVDVTLPDQVFGAYAAALIATGNVDKTDVNELEQKVAMQFLMDYVDAVTGSEMDLVTFTNTLNKLGKGNDLTAYNDLYTKAVNGYKNYVTVNVVDAGEEIDVSVPGKTSIDALLGLMGIDTSSLSNYLSMVKEYKDGGTIEAEAKAALTNTDKTYYALIVDAQAGGLTNKFEAPSSVDVLQKELSELSGYSAVILLDDVTGALTIGGTTVLDLNGKTITGDITANGTLVIVDSTLGNEGGVEGTITKGTNGAVTIVGGSYTDDVEGKGYLKDGYKVDGGAVVNELYAIEATGTDAYTVTIHSDFETRPNKEMALALAADLASDLALNFCDAASLSVGGYEVYSVAFDDMVAWFDSTGRVDTLIGDVVNNWLKIDGVKNLANDLMAKILDFGTVAADLTVAEYQVVSNPWNIALAHNTDEDYVNASVVANTEKTDTITLTVKMDGELATNLYGELADIATASAKIETLTLDYSDKVFELDAAGNASVTLDLTGDKNADYITVIAVALAEGGNDELLEVVKAGGSSFEQKAAFDKVTVKDVFDALKALNWNDDFTAMAAENDLTVDASLNAAYKKLAVAAGWALDKLNITGSDAQKMGDLDKDNDGVYEYSKENFTRDLSRTVKGYTLNAAGTVTAASLSVALFGEIPTYKVTVENGTLVGGDYDGKTEGYYAEGATVTVKADDRTDENLTFVEWTGAEFDKASVEDPNTFTMPAAEVNVIATYKDVEVPAETYTVTVEYGTSDKATYEANETVTITAESRVGRKFTYWSIVSCDVDVDETNFFADKNSATTTFTMPAGNITVKANYKTTSSGGSGGSSYKCNCCCKDCPGGRACKCGKDCPSEKFTDLDTGKWYHEYTDYVICSGLMNGVEETLFAPNGYTTRAMIITTLYRIEGSPKVVGANIYTDVENGSWYTDAVIWGTQTGIIEGYGEGLYGPTDAVTREQIATIFYRYAKYKNIGTDLSIELDDYVDGDTVSDWAVAGMRWAVASGLIEGTSEEMLLLDPQFKTTRCQTAALLTRWCREFAK